MDADTWTALARHAAAIVDTPCYVMSASGVRAALDELTSYSSSLPVRHWLSLKTQPMKPLLELWRDWGLGVEVVSPYELAAAIKTSVAPERILVNGTGKQRWLENTRFQNLNVHFDSLTEVLALKDVAKARNWRVGLRCHVPGDNADHSPDQFGMTANEVVDANKLLTASGVIVKGIHFHIRSNVSTVDEFRTALRHVRRACDEAAFQPEYVDVGGGLPVQGERPADGSAASCATFDFRQWRTLLSTIPAHFPKTREVWLENGRFMTARAGVLVVTVIDCKQRDDELFVICDGGRTNHARLSAVEVHEMVVDPNRGGPTRAAVVCGPTCGAVDRLGHFALPESLRAGDRLLWMNAGAYAIPLETRFSYGLAPVIWCDLEGRLSVARARETAEQWWAQWL